MSDFLTLRRFPLRAADLRNYITEGQMAIVPCGCGWGGCRGYVLTSDDDEIAASLN